MDLLIILKKQIIIKKKQCVYFDWKITKFIFFTCIQLTEHFNRYVGTYFKVLISNDVENLKWLIPNV